MKYLTWWESARSIKILLVNSESPNNRCLVRADLMMGADYRGTQWRVVRPVNGAPYKVGAFSDEIGIYTSLQEAKEKMLAYMLARKIAGDATLSGVYFNKLVPEVGAIADKLTGGESWPEQLVTNW